MARALRQIETEEANTAQAQAAATARTPPALRAVKARINRAAAILGMKGHR
jgi:hypothetical protein